MLITTVQIKIFLFKYKLHSFGVSFLICMEVLFSLWHASYKMTDMYFHASFCYLYLTLYLSQMALLVEAYPSVLNMKLPLPLLPIYQASLVFFQYSFLLLCGEEHCEKKVFCPKTEHTDLVRCQTQTSGPKVQHTDYWVTLSPI